MADFTPKTIADFVLSNESDTHFITSVIQQKYEFPSNGINTLLLYGGVGGGKTTFADVFFNEYEKSFGGVGGRVEIVQCDRSKKFSDVMLLLNKIVKTSSYHHHCSKHFFLFDEVDNLLTYSQRCLKSWLNRKDIVCVMTTNNIEKVDVGLRSRSYEVEFNLQTSTQPYIDRVKCMLVEENLPTLNDNIVDSIVPKHKGDWRKINLAINKTIPLY